MEITLGDKIKINDEEVPEYLLKALYENLKEKFTPPQSMIAGGVINCTSLRHASVI
ncbi:hypothetical protein [Actinobacillus porcinus]|uniref:hypothetical protein n=1 Tax=Actinobacillus porcinus TaxID=51048 RepID=UPI0023559D3F|nr:hypothetical protein [Actinobacillus porcinus]